MCPSGYVKALVEVNSMKRSALLAFAIGYCILPQAVQAQSIFEAGGVDSMAVGLGAGLGASLSKGMLVNKTYQAGVNAELSAAQILQLQTHAIDQYMKLGCEYQAKKQWQNAEKSFRYVLQVSTLRDGPGSVKASPSLQHLAQVSAAQGNLFDAIGFQERVVGLAKNQRIPEPGSIISAQVALSNYYLQKQDYQHAEPVLQESYDLAQRSPALPQAKREVLTKTYARLLRKIGKGERAEQIDPSPIASTSSTALPPLPSSMPSASSSLPPTQGMPLTPSTASTAPDAMKPTSEPTPINSEPGINSTEVKRQAQSVQEVAQPTEASSAASTIEKSKR
jgi:tetratricopeptide (TPR) repeat protein